MKMRRRNDVSEEEEEALRDAVNRTQAHKAKRTIIRSEVELTTSNLLVEGLVCRYKDLPDGRRQVLELHVPGDFVDLHSFPLSRLDHNIMALTDSQIAVVPHEALRGITEKMPHLSRLLWFSTALDASIHREWMLSLGRRSALGRIAHLFCELHVRLGIVGMTEELSYPLAITQTDLSEITGLTAVHVNRTLKELREQELATLRSGTVTIHDWERLTEVADFDSGYLFLETRRR